MTVVLCVPGAFSFGNIATLQTALGGPQALLTQLGDNTPANILPVNYNDWDVLNGYKDGANRIDAALHTVGLDQKILLFGHSFGAVSNCQWLRQYGPTSTISPSRLTIVNIGNSIRPGGAGAATPNGLAATMGLYLPVGPVDTEYRVYDVAKQFDKWADYPNVTSSPDWWEAFNNVNTGDGYPDNIHVNGYNSVRLTDPSAAQVNVGTVTFMLFETDPLPNAGGVTRAQLETAYNRVVDPSW